MKSSERVQWIDSAKLLALLFVAMDHNHFIDEHIDDVLLAFTMPTFIFLSGMTAKARPIKEELIKIARTILMPYMWLYILTYLYSHLKFFIKLIVRPAFAREHIIEIPKALLGMVVACNTSVSTMEIRPLWFLLALAWCRLIYSILSKVPFSPRAAPIGQVALAILVTVLVRPFEWTVPLFLPWGARCYMVFILGKLLSPYLIRVLSVYTIRRGILKASAAFILYIVLIAGVIYNGKAALYTTVHGKSIILLYALTFMGIWATVLTASIAPPPKWLEYYSKNTLILMPFHRFFGLELIVPLSSAFIVGFDSTKESLYEVIVVSVLAIAITGVPIYLITRYCPWAIGRTGKIGKGRT